MHHILEIPHLLQTRASKVITAFNQQLRHFKEKLNIKTLIKVGVIAILHQLLPDALNKLVSEHIFNWQNNSLRGQV